MKPFFHFLFISMVISIHSHAQKWVDLKYDIDTQFDVPYGTAIDFAGNVEVLKMDISYPINDSIPPCGRPTILIFHGGAFIAGDKAGGIISRIREDYAKRGYLIASASYRLGQFHTSREINCNVSALGLEWNCLNMADTSEWYRAYYRSVQDGKGALRYLVNHSEAFHIDPQNIYVIGESAGGFVAMGVAYIDQEEDVIKKEVGDLEEILPPHRIYEAPCIQSAPYNFDTSIASMDLSRPDLGIFHGTIEYPAQKPYRIRAVGNIYGGVMNNIFKSKNENLPALYLYHQPNDLIVPINQGRVLDGFVQCARSLGCGNIINRVNLWGSQGVVDMLKSMDNQGEKIPDYYFDKTDNNANCLLQLSNPSLSGHSIDNYDLRMNNMSQFFASHMSTCQTVSTHSDLKSEILIYPNPNYSETLIIEGDLEGCEIRVYNSQGKNVNTKRTLTIMKLYTIDVSDYNPGVYIIQISKEKTQQSTKVVIH